MDPNIKFQPLISSIQKVLLFETKSKLYLIGSNNKETRFRSLEIDRTSNELSIYESPHELEKGDIRKFAQSRSFVRSISAYGVLGFVRFLEGYYLVLVTKRTRCAFIGKNIIYTIKDTAMIRVNEGYGKQIHPLEQRYVKMFTNVDMNSNFYFSYSYDLTRSLQYNMSHPKFVGLSSNIEVDEPLPEWTSRNNEKMEYAYRGVSRERFVWNSYLLKSMSNILHKDWMLDVIHGFISQSSISIFGRPVYVCLIARRSTKYAGTRFLKRGANYLGDVANEVETEQIVMDGNRLCSFTQLRGSVPSHWSQDISKMVPKPQISLDLSDPYGETSGKHYQRLLFDYGAPLIVLNLVKNREKRRHESILAVEMKANIEYLNQFLPPPHRIKYIDFDMARKSRGKGNVMQSLAEYAESVVQSNGMFFFDNVIIQQQTGMVRTNCVDCLDRTNTAQFAIGKCALGHQLYNLGFLKEPKLEFESDCVTMLENLYEEHGDTLALQYGGSHLVHRIKTYRKTAAWTSQGNDIMQTLSRYISNTFSDTDKQHSINLFLGYYIPSEYENKNIHIWDLETDYYIHNTGVDKIREISDAPLTQWVSPFIMKHLPYSTSDNNRMVKELIRIHTDDFEIIDYYSNFHYPYKLTSFEEHIAFQLSHLARNFVPTFRTNFSPFEPTRRREDRSSIKNPSLTGQSSTSSTNSSSEDDDSDTEEEEQSKSFKIPASSGKMEESHTINSLFPLMEDIYGFKLKTPCKNDLIKYKKYVQMFKSSNPNYSKNNQFVNGKETEKRHDDLFVKTPERRSSSDNIEIPTVSEESIKIYDNYCNSVRNIRKNVYNDTSDVIKNYFNFIK